MYEQLPYVRPSLLFVLGGQSFVIPPEMEEQRLRRTGSAIGGSGGVEAGRVARVTIEDKGHLVPQESPNECADAMARWLVGELSRWRDQDNAFREMWEAKSLVEKSGIDSQWREIFPKIGQKRLPADKDSKI